MFRDRTFKRAAFLILLCMAVSFPACGQGRGGSPTPAETPTLTPVPEGWWARLIQQNRTDVSRDMTGSPEEEAYFARPVSACKTVCLGDFEFSMTTPKTIYRLSELQNGTDSIQVTLSLRYAGEKESVTISSREDPFKGLMVTDSNQNWEGGGAYDVEMHHTLKRGEELHIISRIGRMRRSCPFMIRLHSSSLDSRSLNRERSGSSPFMRCLRK